ncbi:MAG: ferredoxin:glutaredoxin reductase [Candidatus Bathyarchaeota archaeon]|nr:MAG: ferredoxin-thioredoxin reductase catalytic domain-containing protein [Candidatus Bathyarchaeum tardum]WNZ29305.1 MAG: ferredoxin:glutaredoxin reductase [Candidatus Bathyarchaeota archaeon]
MTNLENIKKRVESDAKANGYYLTPDPEMLQDLLEGLQKNEERYGYPLCPCRLASGKLELDRDIICPCDYRDPDIVDYGQCYCALYVSKDVNESKKIQQIPERRPIEKQGRAYSASAEEQTPQNTTQKEKKDTEINIKLWYCQQCGYVCFREDPPYVCPICKAKKEMFAKIGIVTKVHSQK